MKLLSRAQFLELPEGVFYAKNPQHGTDGVTSVSLCFDALEVKGETCRSADGRAIDWRSLSLNIWDFHDSNDMHDHWEAMRSKGVSMPFNDGMTRDGLFDEDDLFLVYERADLDALAKLVEAAKAVTP